jgi:hypothetical protein
MRTQYIPIGEAKPGMVLGGTAFGVEGSYLTLSLPTDQVLTEDSIYQLVRHQVEYIFVAAEDPRSEDQKAEDAAQAARQAMQIFAGADLAEPTMAALFAQVLAYRSA